MQIEIDAATTAAEIKLHWADGIKLTGATSGSIELDVPATVSGGDISLTLPMGRQRWSVSAE